MNEPPLKTTTRWRIRLVETVARLFGIPIKFDVYDLHEVKVRDVNLYIADCLKIADQVFDMSEDDRKKFFDWLRPFLMEFIHNPFNLHDSPFWTVCHWHGIQLGNDPRLPQYECRFQEALARGMKLHGW